MEALQSQKPRRLIIPLLKSAEVAPSFTAAPSVNGFDHVFDVTEASHPGHHGHGHQKHGQGHVYPAEVYYHFDKK